MDINKNLSFLHKELQNLYSSLCTEKKALDDNKKSKDGLCLICCRNGRSLAAVISYKLSLLR